MMSTKIIDWFNSISLKWATNYPKAWSLGWWTFLVTTGSFIGFFILLAVIIPVSKRVFPDLESWFGLLMIPIVLWEIFIIYRIVKYNSEKIYGNRTRLHNFIELPSYILQIFIPLLIPLLFVSVVNYRVTKLIEPEARMTYEQHFRTSKPFFTINYGEADYRKDHRYIQDLRLSLRYYESDEEYLHRMINGESQQQRDQNERRYNINRIPIGEKIRNHSHEYKKSRPQLYPTGFNLSLPELRNEFQYKGQSSTDSLEGIYFLKHKKEYAFIQKKFVELQHSIETYLEKEPSLSAEELLSLYKNHYYLVDNNPTNDTDLSIRNYDSDVRLFAYGIQELKKSQNWNYFFFSSKLWIGVLIFAFCCSLVLSLFKNLSWQEFLLGIFLWLVIFIVQGITFGISGMDKEVVLILFTIEMIGVFLFTYFKGQEKIRQKRTAVFAMMTSSILPFLFSWILVVLIEVFDFWNWPMFDGYYEYNSAGYRTTIDGFYAFKNTIEISALYAGTLLYLLFWYPLVIKPYWISFQSKPKKS